MSSPSDNLTSIASQYSTSIHYTTSTNYSPTANWNGLWHKCILYGVNTSIFSYYCFLFKIWFDL